MKKATEEKKAWAPEEERAHKFHCPECWTELDDRRWVKDYKGFKWVTCPWCGERVCVNPNE